MTTGLPTGFEGWVAEAARAASGRGLEWLEARRRTALEQARAQGMPTSKDEHWRYTSLTGLREQAFALPTEPLTALQRDDIEEALIDGLDSHRVVLVNGRFIPELSPLEALPKGVRIAGLAQLLESEPDLLQGHLNAVAGDDLPLFAALNTASLDDGVVVIVDGGAVLERPIELVHLSVGLDEPRVAQPRNLVVMQAGARATLIERYLSLGDSLYCTNCVTEVSLGRDAHLAHERIQDESPSAFHIAGLYLRQDTGSNYVGINVGLGARWARTDLCVRFSGEHADCDLQGLYLAGDGQLMDYHLDVAHELPNCRSQENFKGILHGKGRAVFDGLVFVAEDAQKTDAAMSNRNLMLSESAELDTKPQLEINADDVKCSHGTTVGRIEPEMLFYLRSRGISAPIARRMLCLGFAGEIIDKLSTEALRDYVTEQVGQRLESAPLS
ncbi:Fe-S cluster assembly protein SufD [Thiorhodococcus mannitoliphagus]|uniref:Fe-S cluster assembly protein SufD n=1 Tax=Thiorhodococcus mannitoliphagus TaxID=329406 RepID=A0A6P1DUV0_9GAMM|nr:Fe-S cluster assembly protein SufD [Thiorhodococcus mannitoliphagus]NEX21250.1 Fe-S cluster assembly protein SufD [Thiorhodococcus mannitoliphagus]